MAYKDKERQRLKRREWRLANPDKVRAYKQRHKARLISRIGLRAYREHINAQVLTNRHSRRRKLSCHLCHAVFIGDKGRRFCDLHRYSHLRGNQLHKLVKRRLSGALSPNWKGGRTSLRKRIRDNASYKNWRRSVFERDRFTCVLCGARNGQGTYVRLEADHYPLPFAHILDTYKIRTLPQAIRCVTLWDITNGRTLCVSCHNATKDGNPNHTRRSPKK